MITFQSYRSNIVHVLVITFALVFGQNIVCAYAGIDQKRDEQGVNIAEPEPPAVAMEDGIAPQAQEGERPISITWYVGLHQPDQQRRYDIELYPTKKSCGAVLGLVTFITIMALRLRGVHHDEPAPSIWQEDGCPMGCTSAFNASGALVNTTQRSYGSWGPWIIGCNGDARPMSLVIDYQYCGSAAHYSTRSCRAYRNQTVWNPAGVTKEKMIAQISSYCKTYEHIAFCHCDWDWDKEGVCYLNPLDIASHLRRDPYCKPPEDSMNPAGNRRAMSLDDRLKERLKTLRNKRMNNSSHVLRTKNNPRNQAVNQPRQRSKR